MYTTGPSTIFAEDTGHQAQIRSSSQPCSQLTNDAEVNDQVLLQLTRNLANVLVDVFATRESNLQAPVLRVVHVNSTEPLIRRERELSDREDVQIAFPDPRDLSDARTRRRYVNY